jgi:hypothetical protein
VRVGVHGRVGVRGYEVPGSVVVAFEPPSVVVDEVVVGVAEQGEVVEVGFASV